MVTFLHSLDLRQWLLPLFGVAALCGITVFRNGTSKTVRVLNALTVLTITAICFAIAT